MEFCLDFNLEQVIHQPPRLDDTIDVSLTADPKMLKDLSYICGVSHKLILMHLELKHSSKLSTSQTIRDIDKAHNVVLNAGLETFFYTYAEFLQQQTLEQSWNLFTDKLAELAATCVPQT